ncbi:nucleoside-diphosphate kinase [Neorickettsia sp. 179522]|uniref:nucleoside-diphosphate kinase n=1 Tax=Neorickettsia sp. 179522 TaxID=1714371 RepID=UPI000601986F|nr:nucleoside-diphosphate kinase [Neorickettsia sp. 179522]KYH12599.1 phosphodiesterase [Neorickettsia sp. 179522]
MKKTLSILKPDVISRNIIGEVNARIEAAGLQIIAMKQLHLTRAQAEAFYVIHKGRPFFDDLVNFMTSAPVVVQVLSGDDAVNRYRELMGETDPKKAAKGTIRGDFADSIDVNCVHGSDSEENAEAEIAFFFSRCEIFER